MACSHCIIDDEKPKGVRCKNGFPITTGCFATGKLEKNTIGGVHCMDEEYPAPVLPAPAVKGKESEA